MKPITLWNGANELTDQEHADNIEGLFQRIMALTDTSGAVGVVNVYTSNIAPGIPGLVVELSNGLLFGPFALPMASMRWKDARIVGANYLARDVIVWEGSTYIVLKDHAAAALLNTDLVAGNIAMMCRAGRDAEIIKGAYAAGTAYERGSLVLKDLKFWRATVDIPAGGLAPGAPGSAWGIALYQQIATTDTYDTTEAKTAAVIIAELRAEIAALKGRVDALEAA